MKTTAELVSPYMMPIISYPMHKRYSLVCVQLLALFVVVLDELNDNDVYEVSGGLLGLVLYNPSDRDGAVEEANNLESSLRSEEHTSELQSRETISYAVFCLKKKTII